jgi:apolipoprotein N-acyltransferase
LRGDRRSFLIGTAAAVAAGSLLSLANPPVDAGPLAFVALVPLLWALRETRPRRGAWFGLAFGLTYYGILMYWLLPFGVIAWFPLVLSQAGYAALFGALLPLLWRDGRPVRSALAVAALWTAVDWARGAWPVGGFTWGGLGYTQHANPLLLPLASVTGVWGVTFVVALGNAAVLEAATAIRTAAQAAAPAGLRARGLVPVAVAAAAAILPGVILIPLSHDPVPGVTARPPKALHVAVIQGNVPRELASDRLLQASVVGENHIRLHATLANDPPDLAVWPENALAEDPTVDPALGAEVADSIAAVGSPTLVGAVRETPDGRFFNQVLLYSGRGEVLGRYIKIHLVPFGEYVPFRSVFKWTERYRRGNADLVPGDRIRLFDVRGVRVGTPICFENAYPDLFRRFVTAGAQAIVVSTNDSSFLESVASREHVIMSQLRAVETDRWVVQAAISGHSAVVSPRGRVEAETGLFTPAVLEADVVASNARTIYVRWGDWFPWACGLAVLAFLAIVAGGRRGRGGDIGGEPGRAPARDEAPPAGERQPPLPVSGGAPRTLVILPTFNERETIGQVLEGVLDVAPSIDALVIDDGSPDGTGDFVEGVAQGQPRVRLVRRSGKQGLASAYLLGFRTGLDEGYDAMVEMDSDLSHRPEDLPKLLGGAEVHDLTIGSRYVPGGEVTNWSRLRLALSRGGNLYTRLLLGLPVSDATSGYRVYRRSLVEALLSDGITSNGYAFQIELAYRSWRKGFKVGEVPIVFREREHGTSKMSGRIVAEAVLNVAGWAVRDGFNLRLRRGREG